MLKQTRFNKNAEWKLEPYENNVIKPLRDYCDPLRHFNYINIDRFMKKPKQCYFDKNGKWDIDPYEDQYEDYFPLHGSDEMFQMDLKGKLARKPYLCAICKKYHSVGHNNYSTHFRFYVKFQGTNKPYGLYLCNECKRVHIWNSKIYEEHRKFSIP